jgi:hypothetical protein
MAREGLTIESQTLWDHPDLPFERQMIGVLRDLHANAKLRGVATPGQHLRGPCAVTTAPLQRHRYFWRT